MSNKPAAKPASAEMNSGPGFQFREKINRPPKELIDGFREFETPEISDMQNRMYTMSHRLHNLVNDDVIVGPAVTVKVFPGDNLMVHKALDLIQPGDVIVVDASENRNNAVIGDLVASKAKHRGAVGFIIDGLIRDIPSIIEVDIPIFAIGKTAVGPLHRGPGEINFPVSCGGIVVNPGDLIIADKTGVVVVRQEFMTEILTRLCSEKSKLEEYVNNVKKGIFSNDWVDKLLTDSGCNAEKQ